ncbi:MAG TPA: DUF932 domain-containing protein [Pirellulales bacterium]|nr:DUF932 domain-containing protein [Pirellulales bacterium]
MTIDEAITTVADHESKIKEVPASADLKIVDGDTLVIQDSRFRLRDAGFGRFCEQVSAPAGYMRDLPGRVRQPVLQHHLDCCDSGPDRLTVISRDGQFLAFGRPELMRISGQDVLEAVQAGADCDPDVHHFEISDESFRADLLVESATAEAARGDVLRAGVTVRHSLIGDHATQIESFIFRLVCRNGMTHRDCVGSRAARTRRLPSDHHDARKMQIEQVRRLTADVVAKLHEKLNAISGLRRDQVDVDRLMTRFLERGGMSTRQWLPVLRGAWEMEGSEPTAFGVMNAMTRIATHGMENMVGREDQVISPRHRRILGGLAGILAFQQVHICPRCFSTLRGVANENN